MPNSEPAAFTHASFQGHVGIAVADITPPIGIYNRNWGAARNDVADSIHRPLTLTALALSNSESAEPLVLVDADLGWWRTPDTFRRFQERLLTELNLDASRLIFALTHTHAGPPLTQVDDELQGSELHRLWFESLICSTIRTVQKACAATFAATLDWHYGRCGLAAVRDLPDPDPQQSRTLCGYDPAGQPDETLALGRVTDSAGRLVATLVNYACHPTTLAADNTAISPDYIGAMRETIQNVTTTPAVFLLGACGELAPRNQYVADSEIADQHGRQLGYAALATLHDMEPPATQFSFSGTLESGAPLAIWKHQSRSLPGQLTAVRRTVELPLKNWPSADELERQRLACTDRALQERLRRQRDIRRGLGDGATFELPIYAWRMGEAVLIGSCCEPYSQLQQQLRARFPDQMLICMNLINGSIGYLPPAQLYDTNVYPVWQTPFDRGSLEAVIEAMTAIIKELLSRD